MLLLTWHTSATRLLYILSILWESTKLHVCMWPMHCQQQRQQQLQAAAAGQEQHA
jgi:hypothetical protein